MTDPSSELHAFARIELSELLAKEDYTPGELRRIAELIELVHGDAEALPWWERASAAGDEDARDYLVELFNEIVYGVGED